MNVKLLLAVSLSIVFTFCHGQPASEQQEENNPASYFSAKAIPFNDSEDMESLIEAAGNRQLALLGEASHGTHEYYHWRSEISKRLITEKEFNFIAVEGDWAAIYRLNKYVKGLDNAMDSAKEVLETFNRWPEWMWTNTDILNLAEWLKMYNESRPPDKKVGFYGMDVYGQWEAMDDLLNFFRQHLPEKHSEVESKLNCFKRFGTDEWQYARAVASGHDPCNEQLEAVVDIIRRHKEQKTPENAEVWFRAKQNALVLQNAERFYRLAVQNNVESWNRRVDHMWITVQRLMDKYDDGGRGIVWAHNTHVGDSRATSMAANNKYNIGSLSRNNLGEENVFITGFCTYHGKVNAGRQWGSPMEEMNVPPARDGSLGNYLEQVKHEQFYLIFDNQDRTHSVLEEPMGHRAIGVTYNPRSEAGNYVPTLPAYRYDALIFIKETSALKFPE